MTLARVQATGRGQLRFRIVIEGWPYEFVSAASDAGAASEDIVRVVGLVTEGWSFADKIDLIAATASGEPVEVVIADVDGAATRALDTQPSITTFLAADITDSEGDITVLDTTVFPDETYVYIGRERIYVESSTSTVWTAVQRSLGHSVPIYYYASGSEEVAITDYPQHLEGRRVEFYAYGAGQTIDDANDDPFWVGVVSGSPSYDGLRWSFGVDTLLSRLKQKIGGDLADPAPIRGAYYPAGAPFTLAITELTTASAMAPASATAAFAMAGFWETNETFCAALTSEIATQLANPINGSFTQTQVVAMVAPDGTWQLKYTTHASSPKFMVFQGLGPGGALSYVDGIPDPAPTGPSGRTSSVSAATDYVVPLLPQPGLNSHGTVPRTTYGVSSLGDQARRTLLPLGDSERLVSMDESAFPRTRIYIGGSVALVSNATVAQIEWSTNGAGRDVSTAILSDIRASSSSGRWIRVGLAGLSDFIPLVATAANVPSIRFGRQLSRGTFADLVEDLRTNSAIYSSLGGYPTFREDDFDDDSLTAIDAAAQGSPLTSRREWSVFDENDVEEIFAQELRLLGWVPYITSVGKIGFTPLRFATLGEAAEVTLTDADFVGQRGQWLRYEIAPFGLINQWSLRDGYNPLSAEHEGDTVIVIDKQARAAVGQTREIEITPFSVCGNGGFDLVYESTRLAQRILSVFGGPYRILSVRVPLTRWTLTAGSVVRVTWAKVPNGLGTKGVTSKAGVVVGRTLRPREAKIELTIMVTDQRVAGYAPSAKISSVDLGTSGTTGPFTCTLSSDYFQSGDLPSDHWSQGDKIRVFKWGDSTPGTVLGTVGSFSGLTATQIKFTTDSNWTHTGSTWVIGSQVSTSVTSSQQKLYAYIATATAVADFSDEDLQPYTLQ